MRIQSFTIRNFKNIRFAQCDDAPDFLVICGSNGSGKSSILEALMTAKETLGGYGNYNHNPFCVSADEQYCEIDILFKFTQEEIERGNKTLQPHLIESDQDTFQTRVIIDKAGGRRNETQSSQFVRHVLSHYSQTAPFFDYFSAHRQNQKTQVDNWNPNALGEEQMKNMLTNGTNKFYTVKNYLTKLKMQELQRLQQSLKTGTPVYEDSLSEIKTFFNDFFAPMSFEDVNIESAPFRFPINTPMGTIDIDELSSGEKEILNTFIHFHHLNPKNSIVLLDEPDAHLHPELQRRYLQVLRKVGFDNQMIITTHSPEMMTEAGDESLYTVVKYQSTSDENQFMRVSGSQKLHEALSEVMGVSGFVSLNRKIVFIEGESASTDVEFYKKLFPRAQFNITFIPAGDSNMVKSVSDKVFYLLEQGDGFQKFYCVIDGDIENRHTATNKLFKLPAYHVENYLLDESLIFEISHLLLGDKFSLKTATEVESQLIEIVMSPGHLNPYTRALLDSKVFELTQTANDLISQNKFDELKNLQKVEFANLQTDAAKQMNEAIAEGKWKLRCKGRDVLKEYCRRYQIKYDHLRNALIEKTVTPPDDLVHIVEQIRNT